MLPAVRRRLRLFPKPPPPPPGMVFELIVFRDKETNKLHRVNAWVPEEFMTSFARFRMGERLTLEETAMLMDVQERVLREAGLIEDD